MVKLPLSAFIIAKDEADRIAKAILSVREWVDEVIVVDSGSSDDTVALSERLGARVVFNEWPGYGPQKVFAEGLCRNRWLLNLDADEEVTPELCDEIAGMFAHDGEPPLPAYHINVVLTMRFAAPSRWAPSNQPVRLYDKERAGFKDSTVHDTVVLRPGAAGNIGRLKAAMRHYSFRSYRHAVDKINFYSSMQAEDMARRGRVPSAGRILVEPFAAVFKALFLRRYILYGIDGWIEAMIYAFARTLRLAKAREIMLLKARDGDAA